MSYIDDILGTLTAPGSKGTINNFQGLPQQVSNLGNGSYSFNGIPGWNTQDVTDLVNGDMGAGRVFAQDPASASKPVFGVGNPTFNDTGKPLTYGDLWSHPNYAWGAGGAGNFGMPSSEEMGQSQGFFGGNGLGGVAQTVIPPLIIAGATALGGPAGAAAAGAFTGGAQSGNLGGALKGGAISGATSYGTGLASDYLSSTYPQTMASLNPFSGSSENVAPDSFGLSMNANNVSGPMSTPDGFSAPGSFGGASNVGGSMSDLPGFSGANNVSGTNGVTNVSGVQQPQSLFDKVGNFISSNPLTTAAGLVGAGGAIANSLGGSPSNATPESNLGGSLSSFTPSQQPIFGIPQGLSSYTDSSLSPDQTLSGIATKGVYGGGNGPEEQKYFLNLVNNRLVDKSGNVAGDTSSLNPIENSYLAQLGLGGYSNPTDLLKGISNYSP